jgi:hypothetical protein
MVTKYPRFAKLKAVAAPLTPPPIISTFLAGF